MCRVPVENRIGKEGEGWTCAKFLLANERLGIAEVPASKRGVRSLRDIARGEPANGGTLATIRPSPRRSPTSTCRSRRWR